MSFTVFSAHSLRIILFITTAADLSDVCSTHDETFAVKQKHIIFLLCRAHVFCCRLSLHKRHNHRTYCTLKHATCCAVLLGNCMVLVCKLKNETFDYMSCHARCIYIPLSGQLNPHDLCIASSTRSYTVRYHIVRCVMRYDTPVYCALRPVLCATRHSQQIPA